MGGIVEEVGRTRHKTGVVADCHEEGRLAVKTSCILIVPASLAQGVAKRTLHRYISVKVPRVACAFLRYLQGSLGISGAEEAIVYVGTPANRTRVMANFADRPLACAVVPIKAGTEGILYASIVSC